MLVPKRFVGGGPAGVVDGLKLKPDVPGVVEPAGTGEAMPLDETFPDIPFESPRKGEGFDGVCEPPRPAENGLLEAAANPANAPPGFVSPVAPLDDDVFSLVFEDPNPAKLNPPPAALPASAPPNKLLPGGFVPPAPKSELPGGFELPKRPGVDDALVEGAVGPKLNVGGLLDMLIAGVDWKING